MIPAGSLIEFDYTRTFTRTMEKEMHTEADPSVAPSNSTRSSLSVSFSETLSYSYETEEDMPGVVYLIPRLGMVSLPYSTTIVSSFAFTRFEGQGVDFTDTAHAIAAPHSVAEGMAMRESVGGSCLWTAIRGILDTRCTYGNGSPFGSVNTYEWEPDAPYSYGLDATPIVTGYYLEWTQEGMSKVVTGATSAKDSAYYEDAEITMDTVSHLEGTASKNVAIDLSASYDRTDQYFGTRNWGRGNETVRDMATLHWLITPPDGAANCNCGL